MKMKKILFVLFLTVSSALIFPNEEDRVFRINFSPSEMNLNPHLGFTTSEAQIFTAIHEGLVAYNPQDLKPEPAMAESWEISDDGRTYTFHLRKGLKWSNGEALGASDLKASWIKLLNPKNKREYASMLDVIKGAQAYRKGKGKEEALGIEVPDEGTFVVHLAQKTPHFLQLLCHYSFSAVNSGLDENGHWLDMENLPVNGPYVYKGRRQEDSVLLFSKNPFYWDKDRVKIPEIEVLFSKDAKVLMEQFRLYKVDWIASGWGSEKADGQSLHIHPLFATSYFYFNNQEKPWNDPRVRKGLALLLPWEKIRSSSYLPTSRLVPDIPGYPAFEGIEKENIKEAMKLLKEAGYPRGKGLPVIKIRVSSGNDPVLGLMKETWEKYLKTRVVIDEVPYPRFFSSLKEPAYSIGEISWIGDYADPMTFLQMWLSDSSLNDACYKSRRYDKILKQAEGASRFEKLGEAEKLLLMTAQVMPISHSPAINLLDLRFIEGWYPNVLDIHPFKYIGFKSSFEIPGTI